MRPVSFAAIGECMIELSGGASDRWQMGFAGDTFNTAWYVRALLPPKRRVAYVTAVGDDPFSARLHDFIAEAGIETDRIRSVRGRGPGLYAITLEAAERSFTYWRGESAARCLADDAAWLKRATAGAEMLYFSGITLAILAPPARKRLMTAIAAARKGGATVAFDPNYRPALWPDKKTARAAIEAAFHICDIALPTLDDAETLFGARQWRRLVDRLTAGPDACELVVKNGDRPAIVFGDGKHCEVPHRPAKRLVDTTGAGDSFSGGYLAGRLMGLDAFRSAKLGHAVASEVVGGHGALVTIDAKAIVAAAKKRGA